MRRPGAGFACENARVAPIAGVPYFLFDTPAPLSERALRRVCGLSFLYAIYQAEDGGAQLRPVARTDAPYADEGIGRILKYTGKTNELFTRMLLHLAVEASDYGDLPPAELWLLDPVMGKGTTLFEGLVRGYNGCGIEVGEQPVREAVQYLKKYLEREKYKHSYKLQRQSGAAGTSGAFRAVRHSFTLAPTKERMKEDSRTLELICANSMYADRLFRKNTFHILAGDLPYGVKHGNVTAENQSAATRNPKQLLETCLPAWHSVLKRGGALALSWNVFVLPRAPGLRTPCGRRLYREGRRPVAGICAPGRPVDLPGHNRRAERVAGKFDGRPAHMRKRAQPCKKRRVSRKSLCARAYAQRTQSSRFSYVSLSGPRG